MTNRIATNIKWLSSIPSDWKIGKVKQLFYISKELSHKENPTVLSLARSGIKIRDISNNEGQLAANYNNYNFVKIGDLLLNPMDLYSGANCNVSYIEGVISPAYSNLRAKVQLEPKFFDLYFKTQYWAMAMFAHGKGVSFDNRWTLNADALLNYEIPIPPFEEQKKIVSYLNEKINQIDSLISNQEKQIEKLKEYKQALITKAVTKGLHPNVQMKDSGIEWIEEIPQTWKVLKLKYAYQNRNDRYNGKNAPYIALENVISFSGQYIRTETNSTYDFNDSKLAFKGDVIFGKLRPYLAKSLLINNDCCVSSEFAIFSPKSFSSSAFLKYLFLCSRYIDIINSSTIGTKMPRVNIDFLNDTLIPLPPLETQIQIVSFLDSKCLEIDSLLKTITKKIERLKFYKKSIIYEYVTGKKRVSL